MTATTGIVISISAWRIEFNTRTTQTTIYFV